MKKSRIVLLLAVVTTILLSSTTGFATTAYSGSFSNAYTTTGSTTVNSTIYMDNTTARYYDDTDGHWYSPSYFTTTAYFNGQPFANEPTYATTKYSTHTFYYHGSDAPGTGKLRFTNDITGWTNYKLGNGGTFY